jgi:hypothetical protein
MNLSDMSLAEIFAAVLADDRLRWLVCKHTQLVAGPWQPAKAPMFSIGKDDSLWRISPFEWNLDRPSPIVVIHRWWPWCDGPVPSKLDPSDDDVDIEQEEYIAREVRRQGREWVVSFQHTIEYASSQEEAIQKADALLRAHGYFLLTEEVYNANV